MTLPEKTYFLNQLILLSQNDGNDLPYLKNNIREKVSLKRDDTVSKYLFDLQRSLDEFEMPSYFSRNDFLFILPRIDLIWTFFVFNREDRKLNNHIQSQIGRFNSWIASQSELEKCNSVDSSNENKIAGLKPYVFSLEGTKEIISQLESYGKFLSMTLKRLKGGICLENFEQEIETINWEWHNNVQFESDETFEELKKFFKIKFSFFIGYIYFQEQSKEKRQKSAYWINSAVTNSTEQTARIINLWNIFYRMETSAGKQDKFKHNITVIRDHFLYHPNKAKEFLAPAGIYLWGIFQIMKIKSIGSNSERIGQLKSLLLFIREKSQTPSELSLADMVAIGRISTYAYLLLIELLKSSIERATIRDEQISLENQLDFFITEGENQLQNLVRICTHSNEYSSQLKDGKISNFYEENSENDINQLHFQAQLYRLKLLSTGINKSNNKTDLETPKNLFREITRIRKEIVSIYKKIDNSHDLAYAYRDWILAELFSEISILPGRLYSSGKLKLEEEVCFEKVFSFYSENLSPKLSIKNTVRAIQHLSDGLRFGLKKIDSGGWQLILILLEHMVLIFCEPKKVKPTGRKSFDTYYNLIPSARVEECSRLWEEILDFLHETNLILEYRFDKIGTLDWEKYQTIFLDSWIIFKNFFSTYYKYQGIALDLWKLNASFYTDIPNLNLANFFISQMKDKNHPNEILLFGKWDDFKYVPDEYRNRILNRSISIAMGDLQIASRSSLCSYRNLRNYVTTGDINRLGFFDSELETYSKTLELGIRLLLADESRNHMTFEMIFEIPEFLISTASVGFSIQDLADNLSLQMNTARKYAHKLLQIGIIQPFDSNPKFGSDKTSKLKIGEITVPISTKDLPRLFILKTEIAQRRYLQYMEEKKQLTGKRKPKVW